MVGTVRYDQRECGLADVAEMFALSVRFTTFLMTASLLLFNADPYVVWGIGVVVCIANAAFVAFMYIQIGTEAAMKASEEKDTDDVAKLGVPRRCMYLLMKVRRRVLKLVRARKEIELKRVMRILWGGPGHHPEAEHEEPGSPKTQVTESARAHNY